MRETEILRGLGKAKTNCYANGTPFVKGPGTGTSDSIPAHLSRGEAVLPAQTVRAVGPTNIARLIHSTTGRAPAQGLRSGGHYAYGVVGDDGQYIKDTVLDKPNTINTTRRVPGNLVMDPAVQSPAPELIQPNVSSETAHGRAALGSTQPAPAVDPVAPRPLIEPANTGGTAFARKQGIPDPVMPESITPEVKTNLGAPELEVPPPATEPAAPKTVGQRFKDAKAGWSGKPVTPGVTPAAGTAKAGSWAGRATKSVLGGAGKLAAPLTVGLGAYDYANTTKDENRAFANSVGADYDTFGGRVGAGTADLLKHIGDAATFGLATKTGNGLASVLNGGKFFEGWDKDAAQAAPKPAAPTPAAAPAPNQVQTGVIGDNQTMANSAGQNTRLNPAQASAYNQAFENGSLNNGDMRRGTGFVVSKDENGNVIGGTHIDASQQFADGARQQGSQAPMSSREAYRADLLDKAQNSHLKSESAAAMQALAAMDSTDATIHGHDATLEGNRMTNAYNAGQANVKAQDDIMDRYSGDTIDGKLVPNAEVRKDLDRKLGATFSQFNVRRAQISPEAFTEFMTRYEGHLGTKDQNILQDMANFFAQNKTVNSDNLMDYATAEAQPGALWNSNKLRNNNVVTASSQTGSGWFGNGASREQQLLREKDLAVQAQTEKDQSFKNNGR